MFKAQLINDPKRYYPLRRQQLLLSLLIVLPIALLANFFRLPVWISGPSLAAYGAIAWLTWRNQRKMKATNGQQRIELDEQGIRVFDTDGALLERIDLQQIDAIEVTQHNTLPQETFKAFTEELKGYPQRYYVRMTKSGTARQFDFEVDSHYMLKQLEKVAAAWEQRGHAVG